MPRKALRCSIELDVHTVSCPGVYLPYRNDVYLSISLFRGQYRRTQLSMPTFPLMFHEKFRFDKVFYTAYQPQQVADALESDHIRIELVQLSDVRPCGRLLAYYESNARDFLYPYPQYTISYGCADRHLLMQRTLDFPGIAPKLEFSTRTTLSEVDRPIGDTCVDVGLLSDSCLSYRPRSTHSPRRLLSSRHRSPSPGLTLRDSMRTLALCDSRVDKEEKPAFVVRKVNSDLIGRKPGTKHPRPHKLRRSKSRSPSRCKSISKKVKKLKKSPRSLVKDQLCAVCSLYLKHTGRPYWGHSANYHPTGKSLRQAKPAATTDLQLVVREPEWSSYSDDELSDSLSDVSDPGPYPSMSRSHSAGIHRARCSGSPVLHRRSLRERFEDRVITDMIEQKVDDAIRRNRSIERPASRGSSYLDDDFKKIKDLERDLEISRNRSFVHINDGEYWTQKAAEYKGKSHRALFNDNLEKVYSNMYTKAKKFDDRAY